jgi:hypothetical protein
MDNPHMTDKDWDELEHGPFIYSDDEEYFYECKRCKKIWDECEDPKCICLDNNYDNELISFEDHEIKNLPINSSKKDKYEKSNPSCEVKICTNNKIELKD